MLCAIYGTQHLVENPNPKKYPNVIGPVIVFNVNNIGGFVLNLLLCLFCRSYLFRIITKDSGTNKLDVLEKQQTDKYNNVRF